MKKRILSMLLCFVLVITTLLAGCGKKDDKDGDKDVVNQEVSQGDDDENSADENDSASENDSTDNQESTDNKKPTSNKKPTNTTTNKKPTNEKKLTINLIKEGKSEYVIVRSENATSVEILACEELQSYLKKISGTEVKIVTDKQAASGKEIVVGKTNREKKGDFDRTALTEDGFVIKTTDKKVWLVGGGNRGTLYSVYTFLEEYLGVRYYTKDIEKVPTTKTVAIPDIKEDKQVPSVRWRDVDYFGFRNEDFCAKQKINSRFWGKPITDRIGGSIDFWKDAGGHNHFALITPEGKTAGEVFQEHPEYFSMNAEGKRIYGNQLCLTNPDVIRIACETTLEWLREDPDCDYIDISQMDGGMSCLCPDCKKVYAEEGDAYQGTNLRFTNAIANYIKDEFPHVDVTTFAYEYTRKPCTKTRPAENVVIRLCTMGCCFGHEHEGALCNSTGSVGNTINPNSYYTTYFWEDLEAWAEITDKLMIYDYAANFWYNAAPFPDYDLLYQNFNWYARLGITEGIQVEAISGQKSYEFGELRGYLIAKLLWNPEMTEEEYYAHMDDYLEGVFGPGGKYIRQYLDVILEATKDQHFGLSPIIQEMFPTTVETVHDYDELPSDLTVDMVKNYTKVDWTKYWNWYTDVKENPVTAQGTILFGKALAVAKTESQKTEIRNTYLQVEFLKSFYYYDRVVNADGEIRTLISTFIKANKNKFTEEEAKQLPDLIYKQAEQKMYRMYEAYNKTLCETMIDSGDYTSMGLIGLEGWQVFDFMAPPSMWG